MIFAYDFMVVAFVLSGNSNFVAKIISKFAICIARNLRISKVQAFY